jgi:hypothetical protein
MAVALELADMTFAVASVHRPGMWSYNGESSRLVGRVRSLLEQRGIKHSHEEVSRVAYDLLNIWPTERP